MKNLHLTISLLLLLSVLGCKKQAPIMPKPDQQQQAPSDIQQSVDEIRASDFTLTDQKGVAHKLSDYKGKVVVLEWFNYECPFCKYHYETHNTMVDMANEYAQKGVVWLAINSTAHQEVQKNSEYAETYKIPFPILDDRTGTVGRLYGAQRTPEMFIIDGQGKIVYHGAADNAPLGKLQEGQATFVNYVKNALDELLDGKTITTAKTVPYGCTVKYAK